MFSPEHFVAVEIITFSLHGLQQYLVKDDKLKINKERKQRSVQGDAMKKRDQIFQQVLN